VDTPEDFALVSAIYEALYPANPEFTLADVLSLIDASPELAAINTHVKQKQVR
jgi:spore coat polysaccharide biosynthesis protein SpsF